MLAWASLFVVVFVVLVVLAVFVVLVVLFALVVFSLQSQANLLFQIALVCNVVHCQVSTG